MSKILMVVGVANGQIKSELHMDSGALTDLSIFHTHILILADKVKKKVEELSNIKTERYEDG